MVLDGTGPAIIGATHGSPDAGNRLPSADGPVLGSSADDAASHQRFRAGYGLAFPLLSDPDHQVLEAYGAWGEKRLYGKQTVGVLRSTFLIDQDGKVARAWYNVKADGHAAQVLAEIGEYVQTCGPCPSEVSLAQQQCPSLGAQARFLRSEVCSGGGALPFRLREGGRSERVSAA